MKYLTHYTEQAQTDLFKICGALFAFSNKQFEDQRKEADKPYINLGSGLICPQKNAKQLVDGLENILADGIKKDLEENGIDGVIRRELFNHEAFYVGEIEPTVDALEGYGITQDQVIKVYRHIRSTEEVE